MATSLTDQKASLERKLATITDYDIRTAVAAQITAIDKKLNAKSLRVATSGDNKTVAVGDKVYNITERPRFTDVSGYHEPTQFEFRKGKIARRTVTAINPSREIATGGYSYATYGDASRYFVELAATKAQAESNALRDVKTAEEKLEEAQRNLGHAQTIYELITKSPIEATFEVSGNA